MIEKLKSMWRNPASLRRRLTATYATVFLVFQLGALAIAWVLLQDTTTQRMDDRLLSLAQNLSQMVKYAGGESISTADLPRFQPLDRRFSLISLRDSTGTVLAARYGATLEHLPPVDLNQEIYFQPVSSDYSRELFGRENTGRLLTYRFAMPQGQTIFMDLVEVHQGQAQQRRQFIFILLAGVLGGLVAALFSGWTLSGMAITPLEQITAAAKGVHPSNPGTRFNLPETGEEVKRLQSELNEALGRLENAVLVQERFIGNVAHELKTPIAVMLTESELIDPSTDSTEELQQYRKSVTTEMKRLGSMVEGMLTLARSDQAEIFARQTEVPLNDIALDSVVRLTIEAEPKSITLLPTLDESGNATVQGDPDLIATLLDNLIRNAIRHSPDGGTVGVTVSSGADQAFLSVWDEGPGIPEQYLDQITEPFFQVPDQPGIDRRAHWGLGLAIVKTVASAHGGKLSVRNREDRGCVFTVALPNTMTGQLEGGPEPSLQS
ncbi:MAG: hypothetical protein HKN21_03875 [Candidatus Eisenbacteria bacterium]|uniref:histidine kinase n=1 Tax=Eiseniibacteriota bacterium TaxID=2212470 RepID=A0A7Y2E9N9_UNCEI|nr:hypothetical protein [Candidatus Eisenbacteria bacterium]